MQKLKLTMVSAAVCSILANGTVNAAAFSLYMEGSTVALGNYAAGIAAEVPDASTAWYNPAGLAFLGEQQAVVSGAGVFPSIQLSGTSTFSTDGFPPYVQSFTDLQAGKDAFIPALYYALPLGDRAALGFSVVSPFGLSTEYETTSPVRYAATFTEVLTANFSPEVAGKITDNLAVGLGLDLQWARVKFNSVLGSPATLQALAAAGGLVTPMTLDSLSYNKGHSFGVGFHAGILGMFNDKHTRIGLNYQSKTEHTFHGYSELSGRLADPALTNPFTRIRSGSLFSNDIEFPDVVTLSGYHDVNDKFALLGSVVYTGWDVFQYTQLNNVAAYSSALDSQVLTNSASISDYRNAWRFAIGANYQYDEQWLFRVGGGYDETPTTNAERDVRLPDGSRWAVSVGAHYQMSPSLGFDAGYTHLFVPDNPSVNKTALIGTTSSYNVTGNAKLNADLVGLQAVWTLDKEVVPTK